MSVCVVRWGVLWVVVWVCCVSTASVTGLELNYADYYDNNEISQDHEEEGTSPATPCQAADLPRWDKLFVALEDSHMRQNMLLDTLEQCSGGTLSLRTQLEQLAKGACQCHCSPDLESARRGQVEKSSLRLLLRGLLAEMREESAARERRMNTTLQQLLEGGRELSTRLQRLEENNARRGEVDGADGPTGAGLGRMEPMMTQWPGGPQAWGSGLKMFLSDRKWQQVASPAEVAKVGKALVTIATGIETLHVQLGKLTGVFGGTEEGQHRERIKESVR